MPCRLRAWPRCCKPGSAPALPHASSSTPPSTPPRQVNGSTIMGAGGEISDFQHIQTMLDELTTDDYRTDDGITMSPPQVRLSPLQGLSLPCCCRHFDSHLDHDKSSSYRSPDGECGTSPHSPAYASRHEASFITACIPPAGVRVPQSCDVQPPQQDEPAVELARHRRRGAGHRQALPRHGQHAGHALRRLTRHHRCEGVCLHVGGGALRRLAQMQVGWGPWHGSF